MDPRLVLTAFFVGTIAVGCDTSTSSKTAATIESTGLGDAVALQGSTTTSLIFPCDPPARERAADLLDIQPTDLYPGERYPGTGSCVFWTGTNPGDFVVVQLRDLDSDPPAWPCGAQQLTEQRPADINGSAAWVRACTSS